MMFMIQTVNNEPLDENPVYKEALDRFLPEYYSKGEFDYASYAILDIPTLQDLQWLAKQIKKDIILDSDGGQLTIADAYLGEWT